MPLAFVDGGDVEYCVVAPNRNDIAWVVGRMVTDCEIEHDARVQIVPGLSSTMPKYFIVYDRRMDFPVSEETTAWDFMRDCYLLADRDFGGMAKVTYFRACEHASNYLFNHLARVIVRAAEKGADIHREVAFSLNVPPHAVVAVDVEEARKVLKMPYVHG